MKKFKAEDYKIEIMKAPEDEGGYLAYIPELNCWGDGDTIEIAMKEVVDVGNDLIDIAIEDGVSLPIPEKFKEEEYSGRLSLRLPKFLHSELAKRAKKEECSINQLIQSFISLGVGMKYGEEKVVINVKYDTDKIQKSVIEKNQSDWFNNLNERIDKRISNVSN